MATEAVMPSRMPAGGCCTVTFTAEVRVTGSAPGAISRTTPAYSLSGLAHRLTEMPVALRNSSRRFSATLNTTSFSSGRASFITVWPEETTWPASTLRSEEHTSELQSLMRISYAVFCLKKKKKLHNTRTQDAATLH